MGDPGSVGSGTHRYRLVARLGAGRASTVYLGRRRDGAPAAVKVFRPEAVADPHARFRLAAGVKAAAAIRGPCTVRIADADADAKHPWIAMPTHRPSRAPTTCSPRLRRLLRRDRAHPVRGVPGEW